MGFFKKQFSFLCSACAHLFHKGGARLILCGTSWDKLESLYDSLTNDADPREVRKLRLYIQAEVVPYHKYYISAILYCTSLHFKKILLTIENNSAKFKVSIIVP